MEYQNWKIEATDDGRVSVQIGVLGEQDEVVTYLRNAGVSSPEAHVAKVLRTGEASGGSFLAAATVGVTGPTPAAARQIDPLTGKQSDRVGTTGKASTKVAATADSPTVKAEE